MAAVLALALALAPSAARAQLAASAPIATTAWVAEEADSDLARLLALIGSRWGCAPDWRWPDCAFTTAPAHPCATTRAAM